MAVPQKFFYAPAVVYDGRFFSFPDEKTELVIGVKTDNIDPLAVFRTLEEAASTLRTITSSAQKTLLKVMAWGHCRELQDGKLLFAHICPLFVAGLPSESFRCAVCREVRRKRHIEPRFNTRQRMTFQASKWLRRLPYWEQVSLPVPTRSGPSIKRRLSRPIVSVKRSLEYPAVEIRHHQASLSVGRRSPKKLPPISFRERLERIEKTTAALEREVVEVERKAALLKLEEELDLTDSVDMSAANREV